MWLLLFAIHDAGGSGSLGGEGGVAGAAAGLLRSVRKPTTIGMAMKMSDRQSMANP